jgi:uncharacterized protein YcbX
VTGPEAYEENEWEEVKIGFYKYRVARRASGAQQTAQCRGTRVLESFRTADADAPVTRLGVHLTAALTNGAIRVGDELTVLRWRADADDAVPASIPAASVPAPALVSVVAAVS